MKDPKDQKNPNYLHSLESLLSAEYVSTPYGQVCSKMEALCLHCHRGDVVVVPEKALNEIDSEDMVGSTIAEYIAEQKAGS